MVLIDGKQYMPKVPMNRENGAYNSALIYYRNTEQEIETLQKHLKTYAKTIKELSGD